MDENFSLSINNEINPDDINSESFTYGSNGNANDSNKNEYVEVKYNKQIASFFDIYFYGLGMIINGQISVWNFALDGGFWELFVSTCIISFGYVCFSLCLAELVSILPFSGGAFGFVRVTLGFLVGFFVGAYESLEYILYVAAINFSLSAIVVELFSVPVQYSPLLWLMFYGISISIHLRGGRLFYIISNILTIISILLIIIYCTATIQQMNYREYIYPSYAKSNLYSNGGFLVFMRYYSIPAQFYLGMESIPLTGGGDSRLDSTKTIPKVVMFVISTLAFLSFALLFGVSAQYPGVTTADNNMLSQSDAPLSFGYSNLFHISLNTAFVFAIPAFFQGNFFFNIYRKYFNFDCCM